MSCVVYAVLNPSTRGWRRPLIDTCAFVSLMIIGLTNPFSWHVLAIACVTSTCVIHSSTTCVILEPATVRASHTTINMPFTSELSSSRNLMSELLR